MLLISTYQDLLIEIEIYINRLEDLEREQYAIARLYHTNGMEYEIYIEKQVELNNKVAVIEAIVDDKRETQKAILEKLKQTYEPTVNTVIQDRLDNLELENDSLKLQMAMAELAEMGV